MAPSLRSNKESATEIARRYGLEDLSKARTFARRYHINSFASKAFSLMHDWLPGDEEYDSLLPRYLRYESFRRPYYLRDSPILPRRNIPSISARMQYDRRLAEYASERREALKRADNIISRYYLEHDPLALLHVPEEDLVDLDGDEDNANANEGGGSNDKNDGASGTKDKAGNDRAPITVDDHLPAFMFPDSRYHYSRRLRYPRLSSEAMYRILEAGI